MVNLEEEVRIFVNSVPEFTENNVKNFILEKSEGTSMLYVMSSMFRAYITPKYSSYNKLQLCVILYNILEEIYLLEKVLLGDNIDRKYKEDVDSIEQFIFRELAKTHKVVRGAKKYKDVPTKLHVTMVPSKEYP